jgi:hypothetical protein
MSARRGTSADIERYYFERFYAAYPLPDGILSYGDKPDVILRGEQKIGIEITNFFRQSGSLPQSEQRQKPWRTEIVATAQALYRAEGGRGIELTIRFDSSHPITPQRRRKLPGELASLAKQTDNQRSGPLDYSLLLSMPEIASVYLNARDYADATWRLNGAYHVEWMSIAGLEAIVREKEGKSGEYEPCDSYLLLVVVEGMDAAQEQEIRVDGLKIPSDVFEKIFVYKPGFEHVIEVWP